LSSLTKRGVSFALTTLLALSLVTDRPAAAAAAVAAAKPLGQITYQTPPGWQESMPQPNGRIFTASDSTSARSAVILLLYGPTFTGDFAARFDQAVKTTLQGQTIIQKSEARPTRTAEGFPALAQIAITTDAKGERREITEFVAFNANGRLIVAALVAGSQELFTHHQPAMVAFLQHLDLHRLSAPNTPTAAGPLSSPEATRRKAGYVRGAVYDTQGRPLRASRTPVEIRIFGTTYEGHRTEYRTRVDETGHYEIHVPNGLYRVIAEATLTQNGQPFPLGLDPVDGIPPDTDTDSHDGIVKDFQLKLSGSRVGTGPTEHGAGVYVVDGGAFHSYFDALDRKYPTGAYVQILFVPQGAALDGSPLKPFVRNCSLAGMHTGFGLAGIPVTAYTIAARLITPDGNPHTLKVSQNGAADTAERAETLTLTFKSDSASGMHGTLGLNGTEIEYLYVWE